MDERLRPELVSLFRQGAKPPKGPGLKLTQEQLEALVSELQDLRDEVERNNEALIRVLRGKR